MIEVSTWGSMGGYFYLEYTRRTFDYKRIIIYEYRKDHPNRGKRILFEKTSRYDVYSRDKVERSISTSRRYILTEEEALLIMSEEI